MQLNSTMVGVGTFVAAAATATGLAAAATSAPRDEHGLASTKHVVGMTALGLGSAASVVLGAVNASPMRSAAFGGLGFGALAGLSAGVLLGIHQLTPRSTNA